MFKVYCDNCKRETVEPKTIQMDIHDVENPRTKRTDHLRYQLDLCPNCHNIFRKIAEGTGAKPTVNPYE